MSSSSFSQHKVDHLFLLVGENPLPNYVAAKLLVRENGITYLVHSTRTKPEYDNLVNVLKTEGIKTQPVPLGQSEADGNEIQNQINKVLKPKGQPPVSGRVGLNYTGGTKAMAVHAYQAIQSFDSPSEESKVFSYLDSRSLKLFVDGHRSEPVGLAVQPPPSLDTLLQLHNLSKIKEPITQPQLTQAAFSLASEFKKVSNSGFGNSPAVKQWKNWCKESFKKEKQSDGRWKDENELSKELSLNTVESVPQEFRRILREDLQSASESQLRIDLARDRLSNPLLGLTYIYHWLGGGWLEDYVLSRIQEISSQKPQYQIRETFMSLTIRDPEKSWNREQFEFDVGFLIGYQLFAISCTTSSSHDICKQKLFEAQLRARQLGGDESRVALVSCYDQSTDWLRQELSLITGSYREEGQKYDKRVEVFGRNDLDSQRFISKLDKWIYKNIKP